MALAWREVDVSSGPLDAPYLETAGAEAAVASVENLPDLIARTDTPEELTRLIQSIGGAIASE